MQTIKEKIKQINKITPPSGIFEISAYQGDDGGHFVDIVARRTRNQQDENQRFLDLCDAQETIESLGLFLTQCGNIDHEEGKGWIFKIETNK